MGALGNFIFGTPEGFILLRHTTSAEAENEVDIEYCPFCGTRLDEVPQIQLEKFTKPRRRRAVTLPRGSIG